jgi:hypothetical protein
MVKGNKMGAPANPTQWRWFLLPDRRERLRRAGMCSIGDLADDIDERSMPLGDRSPAMARWSDEFLPALMNGLFGRGRRTRVLLLDPKQPVQRVTAGRGQHIVEKHGTKWFRPNRAFRLDQDRRRARLVDDVARRLVHRAMAVRTDDS